MKNINEMSIQIVKLSKNFASSHPDYLLTYKDYEDYVSELTYAIIKNINSYDPSKGQFSTWCYQVFTSKIIKDVMKQMKKKRIANLVSLDDELDDEGNTLIECVSENDNFKEDLEDRMYARELLEKLLPYMSNDFKKYILEGKSAVEIARERNISKQGIYNKLKKEISLFRMAVEKENYKMLEKRLNRKNGERVYEEFESQIIFY